MTRKNDRIKININKDKEMRTKGISKMIGEGGLGADRYYEIEKKSAQKSDSDDNENDNK